MHNSNGTLEFPECGNLIGADWMENLRWPNTEQFMHFRETNTEPSMHIRETNTEPSMHFKRANTDQTMNFRKANTEFLLLVLLPTLLTISLPTLL